jgi:hypothetical protein
VKRNHESGQALISALLTLALAGLFGWFAIRSSGLLGDEVKKRIDKSHEMLAQCQQNAHVLNEIALNNQAILSSLSQAANAWAEAAHWNFTAATIRPWWKRESDEEETKRDNEVFETLDQRVKIALQTARNLTKHNRGLAAKLALSENRLAGSLAAEDAGESMCRAVRMAGVNPAVKPGNMIPKMIPTLVPSLRWKNCILTSYLGTVLDLFQEISTWVPEARDFGILLMRTEGGSQQFRAWMNDCKSSSDGTSALVLHPDLPFSARECTDRCRENPTRALLRPNWTTALRPSRSERYPL